VNRFCDNLCTFCIQARRNPSHPVGDSREILSHIFIRAITNHERVDVYGSVGNNDVSSDLDKLDSNQTAWAAPGFWT